MDHVLLAVIFGLCALACAVAAWFCSFMAYHAFRENPYSRRARRRRAGRESR
jgi:hypothetical protein